MTFPLWNLRGLKLLGDTQWGFSNGVIFVLVSLYLAQISLGSARLVGVLGACAEG